MEQKEQQTDDQEATLSDDEMEKILELVTEFR